MEDDDDELMSSLLTKLSNVQVSSADELVTRFAEVLSIDKELAAFYLSAANGNLEIAINLWLDAGPRRGGASVVASSGGVSSSGATGSASTAFDDSMQSASPSLLASIDDPSVRDPDLYAALQAGQIDQQTYAELSGALHPGSRAGPRSSPPPPAASFAWPTAGGGASSASSAFPVFNFSGFGTAAAAGTAPPPTGGGSGSSTTASAPAPPGAASGDSGAGGGMDTEL